MHAVFLLSPRNIYFTIEAHMSYTHFGNTRTNTSYFSLYFIQRTYICRPQDTTGSKDAGIEPMSTAILRTADQMH